MAPTIAPPVAGATAACPTVELIRRFLDHVLPARFVKIRHFYRAPAPADHLGVRNRERRLRIAIDRDAAHRYFSRMGGAGTVAPMDSVGTHDDRYTAEQYFRLVDSGILQPDDRVELLDGVIVAVPPSGPQHATSASKVVYALILAVGDRACVRSQFPLVAGVFSVPEPDAAVVAGTLDDYATAHPAAALLAVEVSDSSLPQDRLTKARIYAAARIPEYWIVNLRENCVEILRAPDPQARSYGERRIALRGERLDLAALPGVSVAVDDLLPRDGRRAPRSDSA